MKTFAYLTAGFVFAQWSVPAAPLGNAFTYQGRLNEGTGPASGVYDLRFTIYDLATNGAAVGGPLTNSAVSVSNGLFAVTFDFGSGVFTGESRWMEIAVRTNGASEFTALNPRQPLTPLPYAMYAPSAGAASTANVANSATTADVASSVAATNIVGTILEPQLPFSLARTNQVWLLGGNQGTTAATHFFGTTDNEPLQLHVNGRRASRLEPTSDAGTTRSNMVNVVNGSAVNFVATGVRGATISGGGAGLYDGVSYTNSIAADLGTIAGGAGNTLQGLSDGSSIGGGSRNRVLGAYNTTIAGGVDNTIQQGAWNAAIGGGQFNQIQANALASTIGGGYQNSIQTLAYNNNVGGYNSTIAGGLGNTIGSPYAIIGGGGYNTVGTNSNTGVISGGYGNSIANHSWDVTIGGGSYHFVGTNSYYTTIGGGQLNSIGDNANAATVSGGLQNSIQSGAAYSAVAGGFANTIRSNASFSFIAGGANNSAAGQYSFAGGRNAQANHDGAFVWGDSAGAPLASSTSNQFVVRASGGVQFVTGGSGVLVDGAAPLTTQVLSNTAWIVTGNRGMNPTNANFVGTTDNQPLELRVWNRRALRIEPATNSHPNYNFAPNVIGGHQSNSVAPGIVSATIAGGGRVEIGGQDLSHHVNAHHGTIGGGDRNTVNGENGTIAGGGGNWAAGAYSAIAGGLFNTVSSNNLVNNGYSAAIAGGVGNNVSGNYGAIGGGSGNSVNGQYATVPGGGANSAAGQYSFAAGRNAQANHDGTFVWADDSGSAFSSTASRQFAVRANNGVMIQAANTALDLRGGGALRVAGAGLGTSTPAFIHRAVSANISGNVTTIFHPHCDGDPNAILMVTQNWSPNGIYNNHAIGVYYDGTHWAIFNQDLAPMPLNAAFNVLVIKP